MEGDIHGTLIHMGPVWTEVMVRRMVIGMMKTAIIVGIETVFHSFKISHFHLQIKFLTQLVLQE